MDAEQSKFKKYIFICDKHRENAECCAPEGMAIKIKIKEAIIEKGLASQIRVSTSGCLDMCLQGPNVLIMPDNIWFKKVNISDIDKIVQKAVNGLSS